MRILSLKSDKLSIILSIVSFIASSSGLMEIIFPFIALIKVEFLVTMHFLCSYWHLHSSSSQTKAYLVQFLFIHACFEILDIMQCMPYFFFGLSRGMLA